MKHSKKKFLVIGDFYIFHFYDFQNKKVTENEPIKWFKALYGPLCNNGFGSGNS